MRIRPKKLAGEVYEATRWMDNDLNDNEVEVTLLARVSGDFRRATMWDPEEQPEVEIEDVIVTLPVGGDQYHVTLEPEHPLRKKILEIHGEDVEIEALDMHSDATEY